MPASWRQAQSRTGRNVPSLVAFSRAPSAASPWPSCCERVAFSRAPSAASPWPSCWAASSTRRALATLQAADEAASSRQRARVTFAAGSAAASQPRLPTRCAPGTPPLCAGRVVAFSNEHAPAASESCSALAASSTRRALATLQVADEAASSRQRARVTFAAGSAAASQPRLPTRCAPGTPPLCAGRPTALPAHCAPAPSCLGEAESTHRAPAPSVPCPAGVALTHLAQVPLLAYSAMEPEPLTWP